MNVMESFKWQEIVRRGEALLALADPIGIRRAGVAVSRCIPLFGLLLAGGCGTLSGGHGWGQDAIYPVQWERIPKAAQRALLDPVTWVSAGGAAVFAIDDFDEKVSHWAADHTPVFGSQRGARDASDVLVTVLQAEALGTGLLTPSGDDPLGWTFSKAKGIGVECLALYATSGATDLIKDATDRLRPDGSDHKSLPSGHASAAFSGARLANRNLDSLDLAPWVRTSLKTGNLMAASATAWARVEGHKHYPSDVLIGACLGNFITTFIHDAFLNLPEDSRFDFYLEPSPRGLFGSVSWRF